MKGRGMGRLRTAVVHIAFTLLLLSGQIGRSAIAGTTSTYLKITSPANGATVHGTVTIGTTESTSVSWINVFVDRVWVGSNSPTASRPYSVRWNSATVANGRHTVSVTGYDSSNLAIAPALALAWGRRSRLQRHRGGPRRHLRASPLRLPPRRTGSRSRRRQRARPQPERSRSPPARAPA